MTCIQVSQDASKLFGNSHLLKNSPHFVLIHRVKDFSLVNEAEVHVFLQPLALSMIQQMVAIKSLVPLLFLNPTYTSGSSWFMYCLKPILKDLGHYLAGMWNECNSIVAWSFFDIALLWD